MGCAEAVSSVGEWAFETATTLASLRGSGAVGAQWLPAGVERRVYGSDLSVLAVSPASGSGAAPGSLAVSGSLAASGVGGGCVASGPEGSAPQVAPRRMVR